MAFPNIPFIPPQKIMYIVILVVVIFLGMSAFETVEKGTYQIRQFPITGTVSGKMDPGMWCQCFGSVQTWPVSTTVDFTTDHIIPTRFNNGFQSTVLETVRVYMPKSEEEALDVINKT